MAGLVVENGNGKDPCYDEIGLYAQKYRHYGSIITMTY